MCELRSTLPDRAPEFSRYETAWANYLQVQSAWIEAGASSGPMHYRQAQLEPSTGELHCDALELVAARDAFLHNPRW